MHPEVVVGAVRDTFEFLDAEGKLVFNVVGFLRVKCPLAIRHIEDMQLLARDAHLAVKLQALLEPFVGEPHAVVGMAEILDFHLLELARAEGEIARVDFVAERFAALGDAKGQLHPVGIQHVFVLAKDRLRGLRPQIGDLVAGGPEVGLEHQVELPRFG